MSPKQTGPKPETDWSTARGIADEPTIRRFIQSVGGVLIDHRHPNPSFLNADFLFEKAQIVIELKVLERNSVRRIRLRKSWSLWVEELP